MNHSFRSLFLPSTLMNKHDGSEHDAAEQNENSDIAVDLCRVVLFHMHDGT